MTDMPIKPKRAVCPDCLRPQRTCICALAAPVAHVTEVLILQHPQEVYEAKGTARLLHRCLSRSRLAIGEQFDAGLLHSLLFDAWTVAHDKDQERIPIQPILLYPDPAAIRTRHEPDPAQEWLADGTKQFRLIILDGTWRKSRKMLHRNPLLTTLPRLGLAETEASRYLIRKAHRPEQLSTLEAACYALMKLERDIARFEPVLDAFAGFMEQHRRYARPGAADAS